jgi:hypothetical protein
MGRSGKESSKKLKKENRSSHAPNQYLGFSLQTTRFLAKLLEVGDDCNVSLEVFEDIGVEDSAGYRLAEQTKSTHGYNPLSDHSVDFWKTLSNWVDAIRTMELNVNKTFFEIYVSQPKEGQISTQFNRAESIEAASAALSEAKKILWGEAPDYPLRTSMNDPLKGYVSNVFEADETLATSLIKNFKLTCGSGSPIEDLKKSSSLKFIEPDMIDDVLRYSLGWVKEQTDRLIEKGQPAIISVESFLCEIRSFIRRQDRKRILASFAKNPGPKDIQEGLLRRYVQQLELIDSGDDEKIQAVIDFFKASVDRTQWSKKGWVHEDSFNEFEDNLIRTWNNLRKKLSIQLKDYSDIEKGQALYTDCSLHQASLEGLETPPHFTPGSFHSLSDKKIVGWHPNYEIIFKNYKGNKVDNDNSKQGN